MKYIVVLMDGAADKPLEELGGRTPLQAAHKPFIDSLALQSRTGMVKTIPPGMSPGSDTANLSVLGYDPQKYHTGRSPLEAVSMGIDLEDSDIAFRCNLVTLGGNGIYKQKKMIDHSAGEISSQEAKELIETIDKKLGTEHIRFYPGVSYRHLMVWRGGPESFALTPPHDILGKQIGPYLPKGDKARILLGLMQISSCLLEGHPVNEKRQGQEKRMANSIWIWGHGKKPELASFYDKYGLKGSVISAVDLIKGIGACAGLHSVEVEGATGNLDTNFRGKAEAAIEQLKENDFVFIHIEAPDECGHQGDIKGKIKAIEEIDLKVIGPLWDSLKKSGQQHKIMVLSDHPTPIHARTHTREPVPFLIHDSRKADKATEAAYDEFWPKNNGLYVEEGHKLMDIFLEK